MESFLLFDVSAEYFMIHKLDNNIIRKSKNPAKPKRKVQNPAKIGENHNSKRLLKYKSHNIGMTKKEHWKPSKSDALFLHIDHATL